MHSSTLTCPHMSTKGPPFCLLHAVSLISVPTCQDPLSSDCIQPSRIQLIPPSSHLTSASCGVVSLTQHAATQHFNCRPLLAPANFPFWRPTTPNSRSRRRKQHVRCGRADALHLELPALPSMAILAGCDNTAHRRHAPLENRALTASSRCG